MAEPTPSLPEPLSEPELDRLQELLKSFGAGAMNLAQLDGFSVSVLCTSDTAMAEDFLDAITGVADGEIPGEADGTLDEFLDLLDRHWDDIALTLAGGESWDPLLDRDEHGRPRGREWAKGFTHAISLHYGAWEPVIEAGDSDEAFLDLEPIVVLAHEDDPDPARRAGPISDELRAALLARMVDRLPALHEALARHRRVELRREREADTVRREQPKIGRNEPCPCGSGKKFKKCCGAATG